MTWRDNLPREGLGAFRGIEFFVQRTESTIGRVVVVHEYPGRPDPYVEDVRRASRRFNLSCFVLGDDYDVTRDDLREAFETAGPGKLLHPYWGEFQAVLVEPPTIPESPDEQGIARFTLSLIEVGDKVLTKAIPDVEDEVEVKADVAADAAAAEFEEDFSVLEAINETRNAIASSIATMTTAIASARSKVNSALAIIDTVADAVSAIADAVNALILLPGQLAAAVKGAIGSILNAVSRIDSSLSDLISNGGQETSPGTNNLFGDFRAAKVGDLIDTLAANGSQLPPQILTNADQSSLAQQNQEAAVQLYRGMSIIEGARAVSRLDYESRDVALNTAVQLDALLADLMLDAGDLLYAALADLREALARQLAAKAEALPALVEYIPPEERPVLAIAYDLHEDATRETEIIGRNNIKNPMAVEVQVPLKVIVS